MEPFREKFEGTTTHILKILLHSWVTMWLNKLNPATHAVALLQALMAALHAAQLLHLWRIGCSGGNLLAMASNLITMASNLLEMASNSGDFCPWPHSGKKSQCQLPARAFFTSIDGGLRADSSCLSGASHRSKITLPSRGRFV